MIQALAKDREPVVVFDCRTPETPPSGPAFVRSSSGSASLGLLCFSACLQRQKEKAAR
jgi:hypothetical protein